MFETFKNLQYLAGTAPRHSLVILLLFILASGVAEMVGVGLISAYAGMIGGETPAQQAGESELLTGWFTTISHMNVVTLTLGLFGFFLVKNLGLATGVFYQSRFVTQLEARVSSQIFNSHLKCDYLTTLTTNSATSVRNITQEVGLVFNGAVIRAIEAIAEGVAFLFIVGLILILQPVVFLTTLAALGLLAGGLMVVQSRIAERAGTKRTTLSEHLIRLVSQTSGMAKEVRVFGLQEQMSALFLKTAQAHARAKRTAQLVKRLPRYTNETLFIFGLLIIILSHQFFSSPTSDLVGTLALFAAAGVRLVPGLSRISAAIASIRFYDKSLKIIREELEKVEDATLTLLSQPRRSGGLNFEEKIALNKVGFKYPQADEACLSDLSITIRKGTSIALIGPSGAGKSTLTDVIMGLITPDSGSVEVDGANIAEALDDWRTYIGYVPQSVYLFDASIVDNITFGQKIDKRAQERLRMALEAAQLEPMLDRLPKGLDTVVGENGARLSGGEKQRIGIARALFREPSLLVLDEPTSALDAGTEAAFTDALRCLSHRFTLIVVAHRLSTIGFCDQILEMKNGALRDVTLAHRGTLESGATQ